MTSRRLVPFGILSRYVARALVRPFLIGFSVVTFLLTLEMLLDYLDLILGKGIAVWTVVRLFVLGLGWMVVLSVPCGVLVAALMAYGQMSQDNETTALRASGVNLVATMAPTLILSLLVAVGLALFNNYVLPDTNHAFANLVAEIHKVRPTAHIQEGVFIDDFEGYDLFIRRLDDRTGEMRDILIIDASDSRSSPRTIIAKEGTLQYLPVANALSLTLRDGEIHEADPLAPDGRYRRMVFQEQTMRLKGAAEALSGPSTRARGDREMSVGAMRHEIGKLGGELTTLQAQMDSSLLRLGVKDVSQVPPLDPSELKPRGIHRLTAAVAGFLTGRRPPPPKLPELSPGKRRQIEDLHVLMLQTEGVRKRVDRYQVEIDKKFSIPFACLVFVLIGAPLGMRARRGGLAVGFVSVVFFLFYYLCLIGGEQLADRGIMGPAVAMWLPNVILGILGVHLTRQLAVSGVTPPSPRRGRH